MEQEISLMDLLAAAVRKGAKIIIFAVIVGLLFMGFSYMGNHSAKSEEEESYAMAEKERQMRDLQKTVERAEEGIKAEREYIADSLYMKLNPYDIYQTRVNYLVTNVSVPLDGSLGMMENPTEYAIDRIIARYLLEWNGTDLQTLLNVPGYEDVEDRYLREIIGVGNGGNGNLYINVYANSETESEKLADATAKVLLGLTKDVSAETYSHSVAKVSTVTKQIISESIRSNQESHYDALDTYVDDLSEAQASINKEESSKTRSAYIKKLIIGCLVGGILGGLYEMFHSMVRGVAESTEQVASQTGLKYLGSACSGKEKGLFPKMASGITGEKKWGSDDEALAYLAERTALAGADPLMLTSTDAKVDTAKIEAVLKTLKDKGIAATYQPSIGMDAASLASMQDAGSIVFAVQKGTTKIPDILEVKNLATEAGKPVAGYLML